MINNIFIHTNLIKFKQNSQWCNISKNIRMYVLCIDSDIFIKIFDNHNTFVRLFKFCKFCKFSKQRQPAEVWCYKYILWCYIDLLVFRWNYIYDIFDKQHLDCCDIRYDTKIICEFNIVFILIDLYNTIIYICNITPLLVAVVLKIYKIYKI